MKKTDFLTVTQAARRLGRSGARVRQLISEGHLMADKVHDRLWVISMAEFEKFRKKGGNTNGKRRKSGA